MSFELNKRERGRGEGKEGEESRREGQGAGEKGQRKRREIRAKGGKEGEGRKRLEERLPPAHPQYTPVLTG